MWSDSALTLTTFSKSSVIRRTSSLFLLLGSPLIHVNMYYGHVRLRYEKDKRSIKEVKGIRQELTMKNRNMKTLPGYRSSVSFPTTARRVADTASNGA